MIDYKGDPERGLQKLMEDIRKKRTTQAASTITPVAITTAPTPNPVIYNVYNTPSPSVKTERIRRRPTLTGFVLRLILIVVAFVIGMYFILDPQSFLNWTINSMTKSVNFFNGLL
jgi:hypothetical protein